MKWPAVLILVVLLLSAAIQPIGEFSNVLKEKIVLSSAMMNSCRAARDNTLNIWHMRNLDTVINEDEFIREFSRAFAKSLNLSAVSKGDNVLEFTSNDGRFNKITVAFNMDRMTYEELSDDSLGDMDYYDRPMTLVTARLETPYLFRTFWLRQANGISNDHYKLIDTRKILIQMIN